MNTKTIRVSNVTEKEGQYGPSLKVGYKQGEEWENYFINKAELFPYFVKGKTVTIEYEKKGNWNIIKGVAPESKDGGESGDGGSRNKSIELQTIFKGFCEMYSAQNTEFMPDPLVVAEWVTSVHALIFDAPSPGEVIAKAKAALQEQLAVEEEPEPEPEDF